MRVFHKLLRIDEKEFMRATEATFKLGIWFENWGRLGHNYIHSFGKNGKETWLCDFHHFWLRGVEKGFDSGEYCLELQKTGSAAADRAWHARAARPEDWPFLWGQNEYVVSVGASYILATHAVHTLLTGNTTHGK